MGINKKSKRQAQQSRRKKSEYGLQLNEKQKVKFVYGLQEKQFRNLYAKAEKRPGQVGTNLLVMLESRFDNVVSEWVLQLQEERLDSSLTTDTS